MQASGSGAARRPPAASGAPWASVLDRSLALTVSFLSASPTPSRDGACVIFAIILVDFGACLHGRTDVQMIAAL